MGRSKYLTPVYSALEDSGQHDLAVQWNDENKDFYHPVSEASVVKIIGTDSKINKETEEKIEFEFNIDFGSIMNSIAQEFGNIQDFTEQTMYPIGFLN